MAMIRRDRNNDEDERRRGRASRDEERPARPATEESNPERAATPRPATTEERLPAQRPASTPIRASSNPRSKAAGLASLMVGALIHEGVLDVDFDDPASMEDYRKAMRTITAILTSLELVPEDDRPLFDL